ncbi:glycosyl transferase group 1 [Desulfovibrio sp. X2]|uniref:glycosyltransferase family 4 protein n=1 Tax=Desulfovibrio sp. X2 TaxID=941449 RepID=UPI000358DCAF|nr:glycosyltransferase family 4 protein [Desulfovibrio sp. X2]EPR42678.1 glycosyl transferase group 1 [Desulfovibrio sp. X2]
MMRRSICLFNSNRAWGGGEKWFFDHARLLSERGWTVSAVANVPSELGDRLERRGGIPLLRLPLGNTSFLNPAILLRLSAFFRAQGVEKVIFALPADMKAGGLAARLAGVPDIIFRRGIALPTRDTFFNRFLFRRVLTKLLCNSNDTKRMVLSKNPALIPQERIRVIPNGLDLAAFDAQPGKPLVPVEPGLVTIGAAGRLTKQKGHEYLLQAVAGLKGRGVPFRLLLAGSGELEQDLRRQADGLGISDVVRFLGFVEDIKGFYASLDVLACSSLWEGFGYTLVEAMAMRLPIASFGGSNIPEIVADGETGLLSPPRDATALAANLERLVLDQDLRAGMGEAGRRRLEALFTTERTLGELEGFLLV